MLKIDFTHEIRENALIIRFDGEFSNDNAIAVFDEVSKVISQKRIYNVIFDMSKIETINSRTAGGFAKIFEEIDGFGGLVYITKMNVFIEDTLDLLGMFLFLNKSKDEDSAFIELNNI